MDWADSFAQLLPSCRHRLYIGGRRGCGARIERRPPVGGRGGSEIGAATRRPPLTCCRWQMARTPCGSEFLRESCYTERERVMSTQTGAPVLLCVSGHPTRALHWRLRLKRAFCTARRKRWELLPRLPWIVADEARVFRGSLLLFAAGTEHGGWGEGSMLMTTLRLWVQALALPAAARRRICLHKGGGLAEKHLMWK